MQILFSRNIIPVLFFFLFAKPLVSGFQPFTPHILRASNSQDKKILLHSSNNFWDAIRKINSWKQVEDELLHESETFILDFEEEVKILADESEPYVVDVVETLKEASIPQDFESAIALGCAETIAGFAVGWSFAQLYGSKKTNTAYYSTRGILRAAFMLTGIPDPFDILLGTVLADVGKIIVAAWKKENTEDNGSGKSEGIDYKDSFAGVFRWIIYGKIIQFVGVVGIPMEDGWHFYVFGVVASVLSYATKQMLKMPNFDGSLLDFIKYYLHGGLLFFFFEEIRWVLHLIIPDSFNPELPLDYIVEELEYDLAKIL